MGITTYIKNITRPVRTRYYHYKDSQYLLNVIKKQKEINKERNLIKYINKPGIVFSFDDSFRVEGWYEHIKTLFGYYDIKATFNINAFHHFEGQREHNQDEIDKLIELQSYGHEIAHHTFKHQNVVEYVNNFGVEKWIENEINPLFLWLEKQRHSKTKEKFKKPVSFAFPHFASNETTIKALAPDYFKVVRGGKGNLLTPFNETGFIPSIDVDTNVISDKDLIRNMLKHIKSTGKNIIFTCHSVLSENFIYDERNMNEEEIKSLSYRISPDRLEFIISEAQKNDLEFYTTAEVAGIATFIDKNFEDYIRGLLGLELEQWVFISDLIGITELDLSFKKIKSLDGIQYFLGLEELDIRGNDIKDLRLIKKLPQLKMILKD